MTSLPINIMDESKTDDVVRFLGDIPFLEVIPQEKPSIRYDFSALSGRLKWKGDAVEEQRKLRDEW
jgi:hypothetical protein